MEGVGIGTTVARSRYSSSLVVFHPCDGTAARVNFT